MFPTAKILEAINGKEVLLHYQKHRPDFVLMDIQMPEMNGLEATIKIRELEQNNWHTPIVALTAGALKEEQEKCINAVMDDYLTKPIDKDLLLKVISKHLDDKFSFS